jgi:hypothetical protein
MKKKKIRFESDIELRLPLGNGLGYFTLKMNEKKE